MSRKFFVVAMLLWLAACGSQQAPPVASNSAQPAASAAPDEKPAQDDRTVSEVVRDMSLEALQNSWQPEPDIRKTANLAIAAELLRRGVQLDEIRVSAANAIKRPWDFYGRRVCFPVEVARAEDFAPGSDIESFMGGPAGEIVGSSGETIVDTFVMGGTGDTNVGQSVTICGLIAGKTEVDNAFGGKFTHLVMIGTARN